MNLTDRRRSPLALLLLSALLAAGCSTARNNAGDQAAECQRCHGGANGNAAPPFSTTGETATTALGVGAHQKHLTDSEFRQAIACSECHPVPASGIAHVDGVVALTFGTLARHDGAPATFTVSGGSGTCSGVYCHGATLAAGGTFVTATWNSATPATLGCSSCHAAPPTNHSPGAGNCYACHNLTVTPANTINVAGGHHINGQVDVTGGHGDYAAPATHGPKFFEWLAGAPGALDCASCHGATYDGDPAPSCNACHTAAGWTGWTTNCSFCHGTKSAATQAGYDVAVRPEWAAPPDALAQRLDPVHAPVPERTGAHQTHLTGKGSTSGQAYAAPFPCATCHVVPADVAHAGGPGRAPVALTGSGNLPAALGSYDPAAGTCATYCHGTTLGNATPPSWTGGELGCTGCHGSPPATGKHAVHVTTEGLACTVCHSTTVGPSGAIGPAHVDGSPTVVFLTPEVATYDGTSCTAVCHVPAGPRAWR